MNEEIASSLGAGLIYEDRVPLSWRPLAQAPATAELLRVHESNERVLRCLNALSEYRGEAPDEEHTQELTRLEFKVDLALDMLARLLASHLTIPDPAPVRLGASGLQWESVQAPDPGQHLAIDVHLSERYPSPITVFGTVRGVVALAQGFRVEVEFRDMSEAVRSGIEKLIFRQHRRRIAFARQGLQREEGL